MHEAHAAAGGLTGTGTGPWNLSGDDSGPDHWFLPESVMGGYRLPHYTSGNLVEPLVDGGAYMAHLAARLDGMRPGDSYSFTAWRTTPDVRLRPDVPGFPAYLDLLRSLLAVFHPSDPHVPC